MNASMDRFLDRAEQALVNRDADRAVSEASFLWHILRELDENSFASALSPSTLFRMARDGWPQGDGSIPLFSIVGLPLLPPKTPLLAGDWILRVVPGIGDMGHVSLLASGDLLPRLALEGEGIAAEGDQPGFYGIVIESGAFPHRRDEPFARRILDSRGRLPAHTLSLRPRVLVADTPDESASIGPPKSGQRVPANAREPYLDFDTTENESVAPRKTYIRRTGMPAEEIESLQDDTNTVEDDGSSASLPSPWPQALDAHLTEVAAPHPLRAALDVVSETPRFKKIAFAVADFSASGTRAYAGARDTEQRFIASTGKLAILFAAFQLRKAMREAAALVTDARITKDTQLFATIQRAWRAKIGRYYHGSADSNNSLPALGTLFAATSRSAGGWAIEFNNTTGGDKRRGFFDRLQSAVMNSDDDDAGSCIQDLGFPYIHGCLAEAGIWKDGRGLWIALDYAGSRWWPTTLKDVGSPQAATARSLVQLLTLLEFDELVPGSRSEMLDLLSGARQGKSVGVISYINSGIQSHLSAAALKTLDIRAKVGYTGANTHGDAAIVKHSGTAGDLHYAVALLGGLDGDSAEAAARALDIALGATNAPAAHESDETEETQGAISESASPTTTSRRIRRTGARADDYEPYEDFEPTAGLNEFGPKLRKLWHAMIDGLFQDVINGFTDLATGKWVKGTIETIADGLGVSKTDPAAIAQHRFFNPMSPSTIALADANVNWVAFPNGKGIASHDIYTLFDGDPTATALRSQDEYCEWRVIKNDAGQILRVIFTSEPPEYYQFLHDPFGGGPVLDPAVQTYARQLLVKLYQERCGSAAITLANLQDGAHRYDKGNQYNNQYCVHLQVDANNLFAEVDIAGTTSIVRRKGGKLITNAKDLNDCSTYGLMKRRSDPLIGDTVNGAARENRMVTLQNPVGLYMTSLDTRGWTTPDGTDPQSFWTVLKGHVDKDPRRSMIVRAQYAVPTSKKYTVSNIKIGGVPISFGGQIAENVHMRLGVRVGPKDTDLTGGKLAAITPVPCP
jgi:hypothetical protein